VRGIGCAPVACVICVIFRMTMRRVVFRLTAQTVMTTTVFYGMEGDGGSQSGNRPGRRKVSCVQEIVVCNSVVGCCGE
jgi:hypothetical protein